MRRAATTIVIFFVLLSTAFVAAYLLGWITPTTEPSPPPSFVARTQSPVIADTPTPAASQLVLEGLVRDSVTRAPIAKARITAASVETETNERGEFELALDAAVPVRVFAAGYPPREVAIRTDQINVIELEPGVRVSGRVIYAHDQTSVVNARVQCSQRDVFVFESPEAATDTNGEFTLVGCWTSEVVLTLRHDQMAAALHSLGARRPGEHVQNVVLQAVVGGRVLGTVEDPDGPVANVRIDAFSVEQTRSPVPRFLYDRVTSDANGEFETRALPPGTWDLIVTTRDGRTGSETVTITGSTERATVSVPALGQIAGTVYRNGKPVVGAYVDVEWMPPDPYDSAVPIEQRQAGFGKATALDPVLTQAKGRFSFESIPPGRYGLRANDDRGVATMWVTGADDNLYVELLPGGEIVGTIHEWKPNTLGKASARRETDDDSSPAFRPRGVIENGLFRLAPVPEGSWKISVWTPDGELPQQSANVRAGTTVELHWYSEN